MRFLFASLALFAIAAFALASHGQAQIVQPVVPVQQVQARAVVYQPVVQQVQAQCDQCVQQVQAVQHVQQVQQVVAQPVYAQTVAQAVVAQPVLAVRQPFRQAIFGRQLNINIGGRRGLFSSGRNVNRIVVRQRR